MAENAVFMFYNNNSYQTLYEICILAKSRSLNFKQ